MPSCLSLAFAKLPKLDKLPSEMAPAEAVFEGQRPVVVLAYAPPDDKKLRVNAQSKVKTPPKDKTPLPTLSPSGDAVDTFTQGAVMKAITDTEFDAKLGATLVVRTAEAVVVVLGAGEAVEPGVKAEDLGGHIAQALVQYKIPQATLLFDGDDKDAVAGVAFGAVLGGYYFNRYFTKGDRAEPPKHKLTLASPLGRKPAAAFKKELALAEGVFLARDLLFEPANVLTPETFAKRCKALKKYGLSVEVLGEAAMQKKGMNLLLSVGQGSAKQSQLVIMRWNGGLRTAKPIALIGKGVCFDTGGISLKPALGMEDMKWDMGGAAAVVGAMLAIAGRRLKKNVVGVIGLVENMPDGGATRPGDVIRSMSGQTVEVINTDAEGRLVLADAMTYVLKRFKPVTMVDLATLTGAVIVALGKSHAGLFSTDDALAEALMKAGEEVGEKAWRLPLGEEYDELLKSHIADMKNVGGKWAGSVTAACFLQRFVGDTPWAHLDIAGMAWSDKGKPTVPEGGTGYGVRLLTRWLESQ